MGAGAPCAARRPPPPQPAASRRRGSRGAEACGSGHQGAGPLSAVSRVRVVVRDVGRAAVQGGADGALALELEAGVITPEVGRRPLRRVQHRGRVGARRDGEMGPHVPLRGGEGPDVHVVRPDDGRDRLEPRAHLGDVDVRRHPRHQQVHRLAHRPVRRVEHEEREEVRADRVDAVPVRHAARVEPPVRKGPDEGCGDADAD
mmetsp:Transcript_35934/g.118973  ORF Transcript_35934/g.118973 Transcript_35934/m.118973 type:complete len:202 (-) Transcript_35934:77-682(-)